jgi:Transposase DDE domain.
MSNSTPTQLRFAPSAGFSIRADFDGGGLSSDLGPLLLQGIDRQIGLTARLTSALSDRRHPGYVQHPLRDLLTQRIFQIASGYEDGNDSQSLRHDPMFRLGTGRAPFDPKAVLASGATLSRFEHAASTRDIYRASQALVEQFIAGFAQPPAALVLDMDHSEDVVHGQQPLAFYNAHYRSTCYLPLFIFDGLSGALVTAVLRPGKRPTGAENAMIMARVLKLIRRHFPNTHILVRGDGHFSTPELMCLCDAMPHIDFLFGLAGNPVLHRLAEPVMQRARALAATQQALGEAASVKLYDEFDYAAGSWHKPWRVVLKAEVMALGDNPRFVVTSMNLPEPQTVYADLYCARGQAENFIKQVKCDLAADRTSCTTFLANCMRLILHCAAYVLHQQLRVHALSHTTLAAAQPHTVILKLFKVATQIKQYKDRIVLHLPSAYPFKHLLHTLTERLYIPKPPGLSSA